MSAEDRKRNPDDYRDSFSVLVQHGYVAKMQHQEHYYIKYLPTENKNDVSITYHRGEDGRLKLTVDSCVEHHEPIDVTVYLNSRSKEKRDTVKCTLEPGFTHHE